MPSSCISRSSPRRRRSGPRRRARARILEWLFFESAHWQGAIAAALGGRVAHRFPTLPDVPPDWSSLPVRTVLARVEWALGVEEFLAGPLSIADFSLAGMATYFTAGEFPEALYPKIAAWWGRLAALPAFQVTECELWRISERGAG
jgi:glutathione S-transferase